jgi:L-ribulose-5-phosphate 3-epimerase
MKHDDKNEAPNPGSGRREMLARSAALLAVPGVLGASSPPPAPSVQKPVRPRSSPRRYDMKKSINMWAFPYPGEWSLKECLQLSKDAGFDAVELNFDLTGEFSAESSDGQIKEVGELARKIGIGISGICSFLFWPYPLTAADPEKRKKAMELGARMIQAAALLKTENLLIVPGAVYAGWVEGFEPVPNDVCDRRAREAIRRMIPLAEKSGVYLNIENIFGNGFLFSPQEMNEFVDSFRSKWVRIHFDTGNIMQYQFPEHWVPMLGKRIKNIHFKEWDKRTHEFNLHTFRPLLDGTTNWPAVMGELEKIGYRDHLTFEYFHPFQHYPEALIYQTSDALDWMLGRKG